MSGIPRPAGIPVPVRRSGSTAQRPSTCPNSSSTTRSNAGCNQSQAPGTRYEGSIPRPSGIRPPSVSARQPPPSGQATQASRIAGLTRVGGAIPRATAAPTRIPSVGGGRMVTSTPMTRADTGIRPPGSQLPGPRGAPPGATMSRIARVSQQQQPQQPPRQQVPVRSSGYGAPPPKASSRSVTVKTATTRTGPKVTMKRSSTQIEEIEEDLNRTPPAGQYFLPMRPGAPGPYSSPVNLRERMVLNPYNVPCSNINVKPPEEDVRHRRQLMQRPEFQDYQSGYFQYDPRAEADRQPPPPGRSYYMDERASDSSWFDGDDVEDLEAEVSAILLETSMQRPKTGMTATGARRTSTSPPLITTDEGTMPATAQVIATRSFSAMPGMPHVVSHELVSVENLGDGRAERIHLVSQHATPPGHVRPPSSPEMVKVISSVTIAPGVKQSVDTVEYMGPPEDLVRDPDLPDAETVARLVADESATVAQAQNIQIPDVKLSSPDNYTLRRKADKFNLDEPTVSLLEQSIAMATAPLQGATEDPDPEMIAQLMNTEERGLAMDAPPTAMYNFLFAENNEPIIDVASVAPTPLQDVVIPTTMPDMIAELLQTSEILKILSHAEAEGEKNMNGTTYCKVVGNAPLQSRNLAHKGKRTKRRRASLLQQELPPWAIQNVEPVIDLVGGALAESRTADDSLLGEDDPLIDGIEYVLHTEMPKHYSQVQLRGAQQPPWFPGYLVALPEFNNGVGVVRTPSRVLNAAWKATHPDIFDDASMTVI